MKVRQIRCPSCDHVLLRLGVEGQKAVQVDPAPPSAPTFAAGVVDVAVEHQPHTPAGGRAQLLIDTLIALVERASKEIPDRNLRSALHADLQALLAEHGRAGA